MHRLLFAKLPGRQRHHHIAVTRLRAGDRTALHTQDFVEVFLVTAGAGIHHRNGRPDPLAAGDLVFVTASDRHCFEAPPGETFAFANLALAPVWWSRFLRVITLAPAVTRPVALRGRSIRLAADRRHDAEAQFSRLLDAAAPHGLLLLETVTALMRELLAPDLDVTRAARRPGSPPPWLAQVKADLQKPELVEHPIGFWQSRSGRSPEHFARACRRHFGASPTELLNRARIERIKARLRAGEEKIAALALECGYQNLGYFYRLFRRLEGCTPRAWALRHGGAATVPR